MEVFSTVFIDRPKFIVCTGLFVDILYKISPDLMNVSLLFHSPGILSHSRSAASQPERSILPVIATFFRWWYSSFVLQPIFASVAVRNRGSKVDGRTFATVQKPWACTMKSIVASFSQEEHLNWCGNVSCIDAKIERYVQGALAKKGLERTFLTKWSSRFTLLALTYQTKHIFWRSFEPNVSTLQTAITLNHTIRIRIGHSSVLVDAGDVKKRWWRKKWLRLIHLFQQHVNISLPWRFWMTPCGWDGQAGSPHTFPKSRTKHQSNLFFSVSATSLMIIKLQ